ncbi:MAG TPA: extracellular solute-binding protein [Streptosporangiaceae bacterium]|nr:extracellular solute-binding protein [Streptosporangiaceae bacterium]
MSARRLALAIAILAAAGLLTGCDNAGAAGPGAAITVYNGQHEQTTDALAAAFTRQTGIRVKVRSDSEDVLVQQIEQEGRASPADVVFTANAPALEVLQERHLLAPLPAATLAAVPAAFDSARGDWAGVSARVSVLVYNTREVKAGELPASVLQLASPRWSGKLAIAPGETDFQPVVTSIAVAYGQRAALRWLRAIRANAAGHVYPDNETVTADVNSGQAQIGIINHYYWYRLRYEIGAGRIHSAIASFAPGDPGCVLDISGATVLASSRHRSAAQRFVAFLVGKQGQQIIARGDSFEYPVGSGVRTSQGLIPFGQLRPDPSGVAAQGDGSLALNLLQQAQLL